MLRIRTFTAWCVKVCKHIGNMGGTWFKRTEPQRNSRINKIASKTLPTAPQDVIRNTRRWLEQMVVGLNLCPFSSSVIARDQVRYAVCDASADAQLKQFFLDELRLLLGTNEHDVATSLLMFTKGAEDFGDYLTLLDWFEQLLEQADLLQHVQLASFHPQYQFEGVAADDLSHFTNRAPYPTIHLLRQEQMTKVLAHVQDPEKIYLDNIKTLNDLGRHQVEDLCPWGK